jgi:large repetitive protein
MNKSGLLAYLLILLSAIGCNVKAVDTNGGIIANHRSYKNEFTLITALNQNYLNGDTIVFILSFPRPVDVTGVPSFAIDIGGVSKTASYVSGTGTDQLHFEYTVTGTDLDTDGISVTPSLLLDPGESVTFEGVNPCGTDIVVPNLTTVKVNATP